MSEGISTFEPFENIKNLINFQNELTLKANSIACTYPNRIHITPIDCNRFNYGKPGGGGIGFAIKASNLVEIQLSNETEFEGPIEIKPIALRALHLMYINLGIKDKFKVKVNLSIEVKAHVGLGSNACLMTAICSSINNLYNSPLSDRQLMQIIGSNFAEAYKDKCVLGLDTGIAPATSLLGGFCLVSMESVIVWHNNFDFIPNVIVAFPEIDRAPFEGAEDDDMLKRSLYEDLKARGNISYEILMDLIPAIENKNLKQIGDIIWNIQFSGTHLSMIQSYGNNGSDIYKIFGEIKKLGAEIVGLSSVGPCIFIISSNQNIIKEYLIKNNIKNMVCEVQSKPLSYI